MSQVLDLDLILEGVMKSLATGCFVILVCAAVSATAADRVVLGEYFTWTG